jgi:hypothetical protein
VILIMAPADRPPRAAKASVAQVAATIFFGLIAIGKRNTWEKDGVTVTPLQVVVGAFVGLIVVLAGLISLALVVSR